MKTITEKHQAKLIALDAERDKAIKEIDDERLIMKALEDIGVMPPAMIVHQAGNEKWLCYRTPRIWEHDDDAPELPALIEMADRVVTAFGATPRWLREDQFMRNCNDKQIVKIREQYPKSRYEEHCGPFCLTFDSGQPDLFFDTTIAGYNVRVKIETDQHRKFGCAEFNASVRVNKQSGEVMEINNRSLDNIPDEIMLKKIYGQHDRASWGLAVVMCPYGTETMSEFTGWFGVPEK